MMILGLIKAYNPNKIYLYTNVYYIKTWVDLGPINIKAAGIGIKRVKI